METALISFLRSIKSIKFWQFLVLVAVLCVSGGATYQVYSRVAAPAAVDLAENQQIIRVEYGDLINKVSTSGNLVYPQRKALSFGSQGTVERILVEEGETVSSGQALVQIDQSAAAAIALAVAQAMIELDAAQKALDELLDPTGVQLAQAHEKVANNVVQVETAQQALADYPLEYAMAFALAQETHSVALLDLASANDEMANFPREFEKQTVAARLAKTEAQIALDQAGDALAGLGQLTLNELAQALQDAADADLDLEAAKEALGNFPLAYLQELAQARETEAQTRVALDSARQALAAYTPDYDQELASAQQDEAVAREAVRLAERALDRYEDANSRRLSLDRDRRDDLEAELAQVQANLSRLRSASSSGVGGLDSLISKWKQSEAILVPELADILESLVAVEQLEADVQVTQVNLADAILEVAQLLSGPDPLHLMELEAGLELAQTNLDRLVQELNVLESGADPLLLQELEASVEVAQSTLIDAELDLAEFRKGSDLLRQEQFQASVSAAQIELVIAEEKLEEIVNPADAASIDVFRAGVTSLEEALANLKSSPPVAGSNDLQKRIAGSEIKLSTARLNLLALEAGADPLELARRQAGLLVAEEAFVHAKADLENLAGGPDPAELTLRQGRLSLAEEILAESQTELHDLLQDPDGFETSLAQAQLASAQQTLEDNLQRREDITLKSPIDGFVSIVSVQEGDQVNPNATVVELVDPSVVEVEGIVDEIDVLLVSVGTRALVTLDALPGQKLEGIVSQVAPAAHNQQGVVTFPIKVRLDVPQGVRLREGLTTVADIVLEEELNVLLVPQQALYGAFDQPVVRLVNSDGLLENRSVVLGNGDDIWVSVKQGLEEGDRVAMEIAEVTTTGSGFRNLRGITRSGGGNRSSNRPR